VKLLEIGALGRQAGRKPRATRPIACLQWLLQLAKAGANAAGGQLHNNTVT